MLNENRSKTLVDLAFLSSSNPFVGLTIMLALFSFAGVPPLVGFFAKFEIFISALSSSFFLASLIIILSSVVSTFFYIRLIKLIYFEKKRENIYLFPITRSCSLVMVLSSFALIFFFFQPTLLLLLTQKMALCLF